MTSAKDNIRAMLVKRGFEELSMKKDLFILDGKNKIGADIFGDNPVIGVFIGGKLEEEGHGVQAVYALRDQILAMWPKDGMKKSPPKCPICDKDMILAVVDVADGGPEVGGVPIEGFICEDEAKHKEKIKGKDAKVKEREANAPKEDIKPNPTAILDEATERFTPHPKMIEQIIKYKEQEAAAKNWIKPEQKPAEIVKPKGEAKKMEPKEPEKSLVAKEPEVALSIDVIKQYICPTATDAEAFNFLQLCHYRGLNPFLKEAYLIKYGAGAASMVVGKDAFTRKAEESPAFDGYEAGIVILNKEGKIEEREGTIVLKDETLLGGYAKVRRKNTTLLFVNKVGMNEFNKNQGNWKTMPAVMIRKCALVGALREAFTKELGGCYDAAELDPNADARQEEAKS